MKFKIFDSKFKSVLKIVFVGGILFSKSLLETILAHNFTVSAIFSYDESKKHSTSDYVSFDDIAKKYNIDNFKVKNINDKENVALMQSYQPDLILVMGWSQIIKNDILSIPSIGIIGSHPTQLPKYRGRAPIPWSILKGLKQSALTFFYMDDGIDDGDILDQQEFQISETDDATSVYSKMTLLGEKMIIENLSALKENNAKRNKQNESQFIEYWPKRTPDDGLINWSESANYIDRLIRATTHPYPGAFTFFNKSKLIIWKAELSDIQQGEAIISKVENKIIVGTGDGSIILKSVSIDDGLEAEPNSILTDNYIGKKLGI